MRSAERSSLCCCRRPAARATDLLPRQERPVVINTKGPSASGKSTLRPLQKTLAGDIGVQWSDFALISPDIWRKQLLDYATLGAAYKYAGAFTAEELQIVDQKLDRYMARKHRRGDMTHLLIDRFRFDSFAPDSDEAGSNLLTRFGQTVYLFFVITPPESLVERAWMRGLEFGRYKAVDDTLAHAVEAYAGIPDVFFTWVRRSDKRIQFEFLDNTVRSRRASAHRRLRRQRDVQCSRASKERWTSSATAASMSMPRSPGVSLPGSHGCWPPNTTPDSCGAAVGGFRKVNFAEQATGRIYLRIESGTPVWVDADGACIGHRGSRYSQRHHGGRAGCACAAKCRASPARSICAAVQARRPPWASGGCALRHSPGRSCPRLAYSRKSQ